MTGDAAQPGADAALSVKTADAPDCLVEGLLRQLLGQLLIAAQPEQIGGDRSAEFAVYLVQVCHDIHLLSGFR